ncbi:MAG: hypothetical protein IJ524_02165 [Bacteroidales bacterium]|nr:hypothetical protein [Bacteroidales bacterium]
MLRKKNTAERVVALVDEMRENSQEMRMWKNIPLAEECVRILRTLKDETPLGKAMACGAICEQLPEYDVPRFVLGILSYERELLEQSDEEPGDNGPTLEEVDQDIQRLTDYIDIQNVSVETFMERHSRHLRFDPVERTPQWEEVYYKAEQECDRLLGDTPRGMGFCFAHWSTFRQVLAKRGIQWRSPAEMNPRVLFD